MDIPSNLIKEVYDVIEGKITEEEFFSTRLDEAEKVSNDWVILEFLKRNMQLFRKFLLAISLNWRIRVLLHSQLLGITQSDLTKKYGIHRNIFRILKGTHTPKGKAKKGDIRTIGKRPPIPNDVFATLAIFTRVPVSWIKEEVPDISWSIEHFKDIKDASLTLKEFLDYLRTTENMAIKNIQQTQGKRNRAWLYDIRGIILKLNCHHDIYIRVAFYQKGGFMIEVFSTHNPLDDYMVLKQILAPFGPIETGYFETVIKNRINPAIVCKSQSEKLKTPIDLKPFNTL
jgi:hypothetical protein